MDVGDNKSGRQYSDYLKSAIRARGLGELRDNVHGLDAFAEGDDVFYCENDMRGSSSYSVDSWKEHISLCLSLIRGVSDRHQNAASLINDSAFNPNPDVQFLLRITAVEALCEQAKASDPLIAFIRTVARTAEESDLNEGDRKEIVDTMNRAKKQSVGSAIRSKITAPLGQETAAHFFKLYRHRSKFVHQGKHRGELGQYADDARRIAVDLLFADVEQNISHAASIEVSL